MNLVNICGFIAVMLYAATLMPTNFCIVYPELRQENIFRFLFKNRRSIGLMTFIISCIHAAIYLHKIGGIDLFALNTYHTYFTGLSSLSIFAILSITSNNWSIKKLKKNWKVIHKFTYVVLFLLLWHIAVLKLVRYSNRNEP